MSGESARRTVARVRSQILVPRSAERRVVGLVACSGLRHRTLHGKPRERAPGHGTRRRDAKPHKGTKYACKACRLCKPRRGIVRIRRRLTQNVNCTTYLCIFCDSVRYISTYVGLDRHWAPARLSFVHVLPLSVDTP